MTAAICLTFDDLHVANWCAARSIFDAFDARVTFCVCKIHTANADQIEGLRALQADGHEIAYHSRTHPRLAPYLETHGLEHWLAQEIDAGVAEHRALGFPATSFASPFHSSTPETRAACASRFRVIRAAGPLGARGDRIATRIYGRPGPDNAVDCVGFCDMQLAAAPGWPGQMRLLDRITEAGGTGVFAGHDIRADRDGKGYYSTQRQIRRLLSAARDRGLGFRTLSEIAGVG